MPAPDLDTIFDIEPAIELACKTVLATYGIAGFTQRETEELPVPRVDIQLRLGAETGHRAIVEGQGILDAWHGSLGFQLVTGRTKRDDPALHGKWRGRIRQAAQYFSGKFSEAVLPYHVLTSIVADGTEPTVQVDEDADVCTLSYKVVVSIRKSAWPV
jgi:hypothetical protein